MGSKWVLNIQQPGQLLSSSENNKTQSSFHILRVYVANNRWTLVDVGPE